MIEEIPSLLLYRAHCHADGCTEVNFRNNKESEWLNEKRQKAMQTVNRYLNSEWGLQFSRGYDLIQSEKDAQKLFPVFQKEFEDAILSIKLSMCHHGRIVFDRKIEFLMHDLDDIDGLIAKIKDFDCMNERNIGQKRLETAFYPDFY